MVELLQHKSQFISWIMFMCSHYECVCMFWGWDRDIDGGEKRDAKTWWGGRDIDMEREVLERERECVCVCLCFAGEIER